MSGGDAVAVRTIAFGDLDSRPVGRGWIGPEPFIALRQAGSRLVGVDRPGDRHRLRGGRGLEPLRGRRRADDFTRERCGVVLRVRRLGPALPGAGQARARRHRADRRGARATRQFARGRRLQPAGLAARRLCLVRTRRRSRADRAASSGGRTGTAATSWSRPCSIRPERSPSPNHGCRRRTPPTGRRRAPVWNCGWTSPTTQTSSTRGEQREKRSA